MRRRYRSKFALVYLAVALAGCGTTRSTDTLRTATEQLLISDAIDHAVQTINFEPLRGQTVYLDDQRLADVVDRNYLVSTLRQHLLASGCQLRDKREEADFVVEARAGAVGTDRNDLLFGVPSMNVPQIPLVQPVPAAIPEIPIAKRRDQRAIAKVAVFAYHRESGTPVWQSGLAHQESSANDVWILGAGPFQRGTIYDGTEFAGKTLNNEIAPSGQIPMPRPLINLAREKSFVSPDKLAHPPTRLPTPEPGIVQAVHAEAPPKIALQPKATAHPKDKVQPAPIEVPEDAKPIESAPPHDEDHLATPQLPQPRFNSP